MFTVGQDVITTREIGGEEIFGCAAMDHHVYPAGTECRIVDVDEDGTLDVWFKDGEQFLFEVTDNLFEVANEPSTT